MAHRELPRQSMSTKANGKCHDNQSVLYQAVFCNYLESCRVQHQRQRQILCQRELETPHSDHFTSDAFANRDRHRKRTREAESESETIRDNNQIHCRSGFLQIIFRTGTIFPTSRGCDLNSGNVHMQYPMQCLSPCLNYR